MVTVPISASGKVNLGRVVALTALTSAAGRVTCFMLGRNRHGDFHYSFRHHLKDIPEAVSESQHVTYSHREWSDSVWGHSGLHGSHLLS